MGGFRFQANANGGIWVSLDGTQGVIQNGVKFPSYIPVNKHGDGWQGVNGYVSEKTLEDAIAALVGTSAKDVVIPPGYAMTSTGKVVLMEDWDEIEGSI